MKQQTKTHILFTLFYFFTPTTLCVTYLSKYVGFNLAYLIVVPIFGEITYKLRTRKEVKNEKTKV